MPRIRTARLQLIPATETHLRAELEGRLALAGALEAEVPPTWPPELYDEDAVHYNLGWVLAHPDDVGWGFYYVVRRVGPGVTPLLIGTGGFKGAPDSAGAVEVGYGILPEHQRQGYATEAVGGWVRSSYRLCPTSRHRWESFGKRAFGSPAMGTTRRRRPANASSATSCPDGNSGSFTSPR